MDRKLGVDYYPEQWPEEQWPTDIELMRELELTYVRVGEFAWALLEPESGQFEFAWLDRAINLMTAAGLQVIMGTPTAAPPPWLTTSYDLFQRDERREIRGPGSRRHVCANNPDYLRFSERIVTALAHHYRAHEGVVGWQVDNEFGGHQTTRCYCSHCWVAFQQWLQQKYGTLESLNQAWGTVFWSALYGAWKQIPLPGLAPAPQNPSLHLDFRRFSSASWVAYQKRQITVLYQHAPYKFITHNFMGQSDAAENQQDYFDLAADLDFVSWNNYPHVASGPEHVALNHTLMRGFKQAPYWVLEQQPGVVNWQPYNRPVKPEQVRLWSYQGFGHGAEAVLYFRWRAARYGQEQYRMGVLRQDGSPTRLFEEIKQITAELSRLPPFERKAAKTAILFDYADWWSLQIDPHQQDFRYFELVKALYRQLWATGVSVDVVRRGQTDLSQYEVLLVPAPILLDEAEAQRWRAFVEQGGRLLVTFRAFAKEPSNIWTAQPLPGHLSELLGVTVEEYLGIPPDMTCAVKNSTTDQHYDYHLWAEILRPTTAEPLLVYADHYWVNRAAVTINHVGQGLAITLGCWLENLLPTEVWQALGLNYLSQPLLIPQGVEIIGVEFADGGDGLLVLNHNKALTMLDLPGVVTDLLTDSEDVKNLFLKPLTVALLRWQQKPS